MTHLITPSLITAGVVLLLVAIADRTDRYTTERDARAFRRWDNPRNFIKY